MLDDFKEGRFRSMFYQNALWTSGKPLSRDIYTVGCLDAGSEYVKSKMFIICVVATVSTLFFIIAIATLQKLLKQIRKQIEVYRWKTLFWGLCGSKRIFDINDQNSLLYLVLCFWCTITFRTINCFFPHYNKISLYLPIWYELHGLLIEWRMMCTTGVTYRLENRHQVKQTLR